MERHQGIVAIEGDTLADMALHYFRTSEQLQCTVRLACAHTPLGWRAAALILERVATEGGIDATLAASEADDACAPPPCWPRTLTDAELLDDTLSAEQLVWRLFSSEGVAPTGPARLPMAAAAPRPPGGHPRRIAARGPGSYGGRRRHHHDLEFCNLDFRFERDEVRGRSAAD